MKLFVSEIGQADRQTDSTLWSSGGGGGGDGETDGQAGRCTSWLTVASSQRHCGGRSADCSESYLPPDVRELGKEQGQVEGELQDVVVMDVHRQRLCRHTMKAKV